MNKTLILIILCFSFLSNSQQKIQLSLSLDANNKIGISIFSNEKLTLQKKMLYANNLYYMVDEIGIDDNQLTLFLYNAKGKFVESYVAYKTIKPDIPPDELDRLQKIDKQNKKENFYFVVNANDSTKMDYDFRIYPNPDALFEDYPCELFNCWYEFYSLKKGKKCKMQVQLKIDSKIYKSNLVEFIY